MKLSKTQKGLGIGAIVAALAYFIWDGNRKRWQLFDLDGNTAWGLLSQATAHHGKLAIRSVAPNHGIEAGDTIFMETPSTRYASKEYTVLDAVTAGNESWIVLKVAANDGADFTGRFKLVKKG